MLVLGKWGPWIHGAPWLANPVLSENLRPVKIPVSKNKVRGGEMAQWVVSHSRNMGLMAEKGVEDMGRSLKLLEQLMKTTELQDQ